MTQIKEQLEKLKPREFWLSSESMYWTYDKPTHESLLTFDHVVIEKSHADLLEALLIEAVKTIEEVKSKLSLTSLTTFPINVRELDGSISQQRPRSITGIAYDSCDKTLVLIAEKLSGPADVDLGEL